MVEGSGCARALRCGYHGWTYRLDGSLQHIPHAEGFPDLDKSQHGLLPVGVQEKSGIVFIGQDLDPDENNMAATLAIIPPLFTQEQQVFDTLEYDLEVNWKIFLESFLEGYHIKPAHKDTFYPFGFDNLTLAETFGNNARVTFPFQRIASLADLPAAERKVDGLLTYVYQLFPNVMVAVLSHHRVMVVLDPLALDKTRVTIYSLTAPGPQGEATLRRARNDAEFVKNTGQTEDIALAQSIQASLHSGANEVFTFGHYESVIGHFHRQLTGLLEGEEVLQL